MEATDDKSMTAAERVLKTTELREQVLTHLPILDVVRARGVSRKFCDTIDSSPVLQNKMYLKVFDSEAKIWVSAEDCTPEKEHEAKVYFNRTKPSDAQDRALEVVTINPLLLVQDYGCKATVLLLCDYARAWLQLSMGTDPMRFGLASEIKAEPILRMNQSALYRDMFLTMPPTTKVRLKCSRMTIGRRGDDPKYRTFKDTETLIENKDGVKLGEVVEVVSRVTWTVQKIEMVIVGYFAANPEEMEQAKRAGLVRS